MSIFRPSPASAPYISAIELSSEKDFFLKENDLYIKYIIFQMIENVIA